MSKFKKTCFECGAKADFLIESMCENCFKEKYPPIEDLKPINAKYCNMCESIKFSNATITKKEFEDRLPLIVKKNLVINKHYILKNVIIKNFKIISNRVEFDFEVDCDFK